MTVNASALADGAGDNDPWLEIHNLGPDTFSLSNFYLTDDASNPTKWALPAQSVSDGSFMLLWLDGEAGEGVDHASFRPQALGGKIYLYYNSGSTSTPIDSVSYPALTENKSLIRIGGSGNQWLVTDSATSNSENPHIGTNPGAASALLRINELMASNTNFIEDPNEAGAFEDWFEIYDPGTAAADMSGMYLTDTMQDPTRGQVPQGVVNEFLVTTFPIADMTATVSSPVVFPQIADGAGISTQFVLMNAGDASESTISLFSNGGSPLGVLK